MKYIFLFVSLLITGIDLAAKEIDFYWVDGTPEDRTEVGIFIKEFEISSELEFAEFEIFADARYLIRINDIMVGSGPSRFFPERQYFDTYSIAPYLKKGKNTIAIKVLSHGMNTFQTPKSSGKIWTDGKVKYKNGKALSLAMNEDWSCRKYLAHSPITPKINFALGPIELHDFGLDTHDWASKAAAENWTLPVKLNVDSASGYFLPREIPFLRQNELTPQSVLAVRPFKNEFNFYSFHLLENDRTRDETSLKYPAAAYTFMESPVEQTVDVMLWWGEYFLNGEKVEKSPEQSKQNHSVLYRFHLKKGKNLFFAKAELRLSALDFYMAVPKSANLEIGLDGKDEAFGVKTFQPNRFDLQKELKVNAAPMDFEKKPNEEGRLNPVFNVAWQALGSSLQSSVQLPLAVETNTGISIDFGKKVLGRVMVIYEAPGDVSFDMSFTEDMKDSLPHTLKRAMMFIGAGFISGGGSETFESFHPYGFRYMQLNIRGKEGQKVIIKDIKLIDETYPYDFEGEFECSDQALNEIWKLGPNSLQACSEDAYLDTPFRERGTYAGDALPSYAINLVLQNDSRILKNTLNYLRGSFAHRFQKSVAPRADGIYGNPDDFPLLFVQSLNWYYQQTGDLAFLEECYPEIEFLLNDWLKYKNSNGTFTVPDRAFIEWVELDKIGGEYTVLNAYLAEAFRIFSTWSTELNKKANTQKFEKEFTELKNAINKVFWNGDLGAFIDGTKGGKKLPTVHPLASAVCLLYDIAEPNLIDRSLVFIAKELEDIGNVSRKRKTTPYGSFYVLNAMYKYEMPSVAERFIKKYWSPMIANGTDTAWENFDNVGIGTLSHVWSAHPTYFLSARVLGVNQAFNNAKFSEDTLVLSPTADHLTWAKGLVPHPKAGLVQVSWKIVGTHLYLDYSTEKLIEVKVEPKGKLASLILEVNSSQP